MLFTFIACPSQGLSKYIEANMHTTCFYLFKKQKRSGNNFLASFSAWQSLSLTLYSLRDHSRIESSHSLRQNDAKLQTHPPSTLHVKMPNLPKIDVYNFRYKISIGILMKLFFLSHECIYK